MVTELKASFYFQGTERINIKSLLRLTNWTGEMSQRLRTLSALPEDLNLFPSAHMAAHSHLKAVTLNLWVSTPLEDQTTFIYESHLDTLHIR